MQFLAAATSEAGAGGAPLWQLGIITTVVTAIAAFVALAAMAYRAGRAPRLRAAVKRSEKLFGLPGWAALPGAGAIASAAVIISGATWDIGLHIDVGRDEGPLGTAAHYPLLLGLFGAFLMGVLAVGLAPRARKGNSPVAFRVPGYGPVPAASVLLLAGSAFGMLAFPLDDVWHRMFGQDVTLWGPTHVMIIGGTLGAGIGGTMLLIEGALAAGRRPFGGGFPLRRPLPVLLGAVFLFFWAAVTHEFNWGVPQYRQIWHPFLLAFGAAQALVMVRLLTGPLGALGAIAVWLPFQAVMSLVIGGPLGVSMPSLPLFVGEAVLIELVALTPLIRRPLPFGVASGVAVGTAGFATEYLWTQIAMPLPWSPSLLPEAIPVALIAGVAGGLVGASTAQALRGELSPHRGSFWAAAAGVAVFVILGFNAADIRNPQGVTAQIAVTDVRQGEVPGADVPGQVANVRVRISDPSLTRDPNWLYVLGWQGQGSFTSDLVRQPDGTFVSAKPVPIGGTWKTMVRLQDDRMSLAAPISFPADPVIDFPGYAAAPLTTRAMIRDPEIMQLERRDDGPTWAWTPASILVLSLNLLMVGLMGVVAVRLGRIPSGTQVQAPAGLIPTVTSRVLGAVGLGGSGGGRGGRGGVSPAR